MIIDNKPFQSIKVSNEISNFKLISEMIKLIKKLNEKLNLKIDENKIISVKYGKRIVLNSENSNLKKIQIDDFIEIVDYNPIKKLFLTIGTHEPDFNMTLHWIIQNARKKANLLVQLNSNLLINHIIKKKNEEEKQIPDNSIEIAKDILIKLRASNTAYLENYGIFIIGNSFNDIEIIINKLTEL
jgi:ASC-1-like (ASCH) protein